MLTLDGTLPMMGTGTSNSGAGLGIGGGVLGGLLAGGVGGALAGGLLGNRNNGGWGGNGYGAAPAATAVATDIVLNPAFQSLQTQIQSLQGQVGHDSIKDQLQDLAIAQQQISEGVNTNLNNVSRDIFSGQANLQTAVAAANFTTLTSVNGLGRDLTASATQALINNLQNFNQLQNSQQTATNQIIAGQTAIASAMATCCCEIKGAISTEGNTTRALINDLNVQNLRDQLAAANGKVSNNEQNQYLLSTILHHITPTVGTVVA